jgi:hypothetical protein
VVCPGISASLVKLAPSVLLDIPVSAGLLVLTVSQVLRATTAKLELPAPPVLKALVASSVLAASLVFPAKTDMTANLVSEATPVKLVPGVQSVLPVNLELLVSRATLDPLAPSADPVSVG